MSTSSDIREALISRLDSHRRDGTLQDQTPRMIREQLSVDLGVDLTEIDAFKLSIKEWIIEETRSGQTHSGAANITAEKLRSIAKTVGVAPSFWSGIDKENVEQLSSRLKEFCISKKVPCADPEGIPTIREAKRYQSIQEAKAELEGIDECNILQSRKRKCREFIPLF